MVFYLLSQHCRVIDTFVQNLRHLSRLYEVHIFCGTLC